VRARDQVHGSTGAAVAAIGTPAWHKLLATKTETAPTAIASRDLDLDFVDEHGVRGKLGGLNARLVVDRQDADHPSVRAVVLELDAPGDFGKERIILAEANVQPRTETPATLADQNGSARDNSAGESLDTQPLRVAIPTVA
jgi:hypothetical protein